MPSYCKGSLIFVKDSWIAYRQLVLPNVSHYDYRTIFNKDLRMLALPEGMGTTEYSPRGNKLLVHNAGILLEITFRSYLALVASVIISSIIYLKTGLILLKGLRSVIL